MAPVMVSSRLHLTLQTSSSIVASGSSTPDVFIHASLAVSTVSSRYHGDSQAMCTGNETCLLLFLGWQKTTPLKYFCCSSKLICPLCQSKQPLFNFLHEMNIICSKREQILFTMACLSTSAKRLWMYFSLLMGEIWCARIHPIMMRQHLLVPAEQQDPVSTFANSSLC